jgi:hypothetical protein
MSDGISIDLGSAVPYIMEGLLGVFGKDSLSGEWRTQIHKIVKLSVDQASFVQCVGMAKPIPISNIYQPTNLVRPEPEKPRTTIEQLLKEGSDAIILAGPGLNERSYHSANNFTLQS